MTTLISNSSLEISTNSLLVLKKGVIIIKYNLHETKLFLDMSEHEIDGCLKCSNAKIKYYKKNEIIISQNDKPMYMYILLEGNVSVCNDSSLGNRMIISTFNNFGNIFGEVYLFINEDKYENYVISNKSTTVLEMPKSFLFQNCGKNCTYHTKLIRNTIGILANKAYMLNQKLQILSSSSLKQKIAKYILKNMDTNNKLVLTMNREAFADYLNVTRTSLSRELSNMSKDGLFSISGNTIIVTRPDQLEILL